MDPRERFTATADDYRRFRPDYPEVLIDWILDDGALGAGDVVVDIGCGTGISSRQLAARGLVVIGVDPNAAMLAEAAAEGGAHIRYLIGDAETLPVAPPVDAIVGGQAFHWFDLDRALPRFREVLRPEGRVVAFWNLRDRADPFMAAYEALLLAHCPDYARVGAEPRAEAVRRHPGLTAVREAAFAHHQRLDRQQLLGRVWSSSYVRHGVSDPQRFDAELEALFDRFAEAGAVRFRYRSVAIGFSPSSSS